VTRFAARPDLSARAEPGTLRLAVSEIAQDSAPDSDREGSHLAPLRHEDGSPIVAPRVVARAVVVAEALFSTADGPPPEARLAWLALELEDFLARAGARSRFVVGLSLFAVWVLAPLVMLRFTSLARMPVAERARALARLEDTFGAPVLAVKALLCVLYYEHPDAALSVGFDGQCLTGDSPLRLPVRS